MVVEEVGFVGKPLEEVLFPVGSASELESLGRIEPEADPPPDGTEALPEPVGNPVELEAVMLGLKSLIEMLPMGMDDVALDEGVTLFFCPVFGPLSGGRKVVPVGTPAAGPGPAFGPKRAV